MKTKAFVKLAASSLILGATMVGCSPAGQAPHPANASDARLDKVAAKAAAQATKAMAAKDFATGIGYAEAAVGASSHNAGYRMLLAQAYLGAGRFTSAETAFSDTLTLSPDQDRAALNLALVEIALGKKAAALGTLGDYRDKIGASDYGLAMALAGDTTEAVRVLELAVRAPDADAKARQNLALAYALAGEWNKAHVTAAQDLTPADADARIIEWANFARPGSGANQVATLLGVHPVDDAGQPQRLALAPTATPVQAAAAIAAPVQVAAIQPIVVAAAPAAPVFAAPNPVVETPPAAFETAAPVAPLAAAPMIHAASAPVKQSIVPASRVNVAASGPRVVDSGKFVVQLGAFENAAVSHDAWNRVSSRFGLRNFEPANSAARVNGANFTRLSIGGFANHAEASQICTRIQNAGGHCFVRGMLSDRPAQWVQRGAPKATRIASR